jgi:hypothetical protein
MWLSGGGSAIYSGRAGTRGFWITDEWGPMWVWRGRVQVVVQHQV